MVERNKGGLLRSDGIIKRSSVWNMCYPLSVARSLTLKFAAKPPPATKGAVYKQQPCTILIFVYFLSFTASVHKMCQSQTRTRYRGMKHDNGQRIFLLLHAQNWCELPGSEVIPFVQGRHRSPIIQVRFRPLHFSPDNIPLLP